MKFLLPIALLIIGGALLSVSIGLFKDWLKKWFPKKIALIGGIMFLLGSAITALKEIRIQNSKNEATQDILDKYSIDLERGKSFFLAEKYDSALNYFEKAILESEKNSEAYYFRGLCYQQKGNYQTAKSNYDQAIELNSDSGQYYFRRGQCDLKIHLFGKAIDDFSQAIRRNPKSEYYANMGIAYYATNNFDSALKNYTMAIELDATDANNFVYRGQVYLDKAQEAYLNQTHNLDNFNSGIVTRIDSSISDFTRAIAYNPEISICYYTRATARIEKIRFLRSSRALTEYVQDVEANYNLASADLNTFTELKGDPCLAYYMKAYSLMLEAGNEKNDSQSKVNINYTYGRVLNYLDSSIKWNYKYGKAYYLKFIVNKWQSKTAAAISDSTLAKAYNYNWIDKKTTGHDLLDQMIMLHPDPLVMHRF